MRKLTITAGLLIATTAYAQTEVVSGVMKGKDYGVTYMLPKTEIEIEVKASKITYTPGEFGKYAEQFLQLKNISTKPDTHWELNSMRVKAIGVPNSNATYFVKMKDKTVAPLIELTEDGIVKSINVPYTPQAAPKKKTEQPAEEPVKRVNPRNFLTEEILMASSTARMAELTAREIYNIRESKNALLRGQAENMPSDGAQLKIMIDNLNIQEKAMTEMFSGTREREEKTFTFRITPNQELANQIIFRFSEKLGVLAGDDLAGAPFYLNLKDLQTVKIPAEEEGEKKKKKKDELEGVAYNVPGKALLTITNGVDKLYEQEISVTQFGTTEYLAPILFNKNSTFKAYFDPVTGGLTKVDREEKEK